MKKEDIRINVIFDAAKGNVPVDSREVTMGEPFGALPRPTRPGYVFLGWFLDGKAVTAETQVQSEEDVTLVAGWEKKAKSKKTSMYRKQRLAVISLAVVAALLIASLVFVNHIVEIYGLDDVYYSEDGTEHTEKYYVRKKGGTYGLYDKKGVKMEVNEEGYYIAHSGNQYVIDAETGAYELYAVVDYDSEGGELLGFSDRIMMFPQIKQKNVYSIEVKNAYGGYLFYRDEQGNAILKGTEEKLANYDPTLFASLCVSCGYTLTMQKLDLTSDQSTAPRLEDGSIDYSAYGLADVYDDEQKLIYTPATYTITKANYAKDGTCTPDLDTVYTVKIGDAILSGGGYYVQLEGREAVYILSSSLKDTILQPVEALVSPIVSYPSTITTQAMLADFLLGRLDITQMPDKEEDIDENMITPIAAFTYQDLEARVNTIFSSTPYVSQMELLKGYEINGDSASEVLGLLHQMEFLSCKKLGITPEALEEYGLDGEVFYLGFLTPIMNEKNVIDSYASNVLLISDKTENNTYYIASFLSDMIVEVDQYYLSFLEWDQSKWYDPYFFQYNIAHVTDLHIQIGDQKYDFIFDNSASDQSDGVNTKNLKVYCTQFTGGKADPHLLDYTLSYTYDLNDGKGERVQTLTGIENFREVYSALLYFTIQGDVDVTEFEKNMGLSIGDFLAQKGDDCDAKLSFHVEDLASILNDYTYTDEDGKEIKLYTENNQRDVVVRFYRYSNRKMLMTLEILDENGESDPANAVGAFYVRPDYFDTISSYIDLLLKKEPINPKGVK